MRLFSRRFASYCALAFCMAAVMLSPVAARADGTTPTETTVFSSAVTGLHDALLGYIGTTMPLVLAIVALLTGIGMMVMWFRKKSKSS